MSRTKPGQICLGFVLMPLDRTKFPDPVTVGHARSEGFSMTMVCFSCGRSVEVDPDVRHPKTQDLLFRDEEALIELHERHPLKCAKCGSREVEVRPKYPSAQGTM